MKNSALKAIVVGMWVLVGVVACGLIGFYLFGLFSNNQAQAKPAPLLTVTSSPITKPIYTGHRIAYSVTGTTTGVNVTYENLQGGISQDDYDMPFNISWINVPNGTYLSVEAQNQMEFGSVTCSIFVDGKLWKTSTSAGPYVICITSGFLEP